MEAMFKDLNLRLEQANKKGKRLESQGNDNKNQGTRSIPKWKLENSGKDKKLKKQGKTYYWCKQHKNDKGTWVLHKPEQCRNTPRNGGLGEDEQESNEICNESDQDQAMTAIEERDGDSCSTFSLEESG